MSEHVERRAGQRWRCARMIDGEPCNELESEPPHGKMSGHAFEPPAPAAPVDEPPTDEEERMLASLEQPIDKLAHECSRGELSESIIMYRIEDLLRQAYAAGRARGIEEGEKGYLKALIRVARNRATQCLYLEELVDGKAIADAIAKEGP